MSALAGAGTGPGAGPEAGPSAAAGAGVVPGAGELGEVIGSSNTEFIAQSHLLYESPPFGAFVRVGGRDETVYGVVFAAYTHSLEPNRLAVAYHRSELELRAEQPQIFELLKTKFEAVIVGYKGKDTVLARLPPKPPRIHAFVYELTPAEVKRVTANYGFLRLLLAGARAPNRAPLDELVAAALRHAVAAHGGDRAFLVGAGKELARLLKDDYETLSSILRRVQ